jgi:hypothetical protein
MAYGQNAPFGLRPIATIHGGSWTEKVNEYYIYASADGLTTYQNSIFTGDPVVCATSIGGTAANGKIGTIAVYNPNYADGTPATFAGTGTAATLGVFMGCEYLSTVTGTNNLIKSPFWPGATQVQPGSVIKAYVLDDPSVIYDIQVSTNIAAAGNVFVGNPVFPNTNANGGAPFNQAGGPGRNFALGIGGGGNFGTVQATIGAGPAEDIGYSDNPAHGSTLTGQSAFYLNVDTSTAAGYNTHDYLKNSATLPLRALGYTQDVRNVPAAIVPGNNVQPTMQNTPFINVRVTLNNAVYAVGSTPTIYVA